MPRQLLSYLLSNTIYTTITSLTVYTHYCHTLAFSTLAFSFKFYLDWSFDWFAPCLDTCGHVDDKRFLRLFSWQRTGYWEVLVGVPELLRVLNGDGKWNSESQVDVAHRCRGGERDLLPIDCGVYKVYVQVYFWHVANLFWQRAKVCHVSKMHLYIYLINSATDG